MIAAYDITSVGSNFQNVTHPAVNINVGAEYRSYPIVEIADNLYMKWVNPANQTTEDINNCKTKFVRTDELPV